MRTFITVDQARELLSLPSGSRPRIFADGTGIYEGQTLKLSSTYYLDKYSETIGSIWISDTMVSDIIGKA